MYNRNWIKVEVLLLGRFIISRKLSLVDKYDRVASFLAIVIYGGRAKILVDSRVINDFGNVLEHVPFLAVSRVINLRSSDN